MPIYEIAVNPVFSLIGGPEVEQEWFFLSYPFGRKRHGVPQHGHSVSEVAIVAELDGILVPGLP